ncbi:MAG: flagellar motor switch protein FliM [Bdellovibrionaceae bacterium]|nr:flagellar motor switch protein FliM [Pseudobdellovibrionaceae bacterium]
MNQVLSQSEVDALLAAVAEGELKQGKPMKREKDNIVPYDLTSQDRLIRGRLPQLDVIYERLMRLFRVSLSNRLRSIASVCMTSTEFLKFGEFINTLPIPTIMTVIRVEGLRGPFLLVTQSKLAYGIIDKIFGGGGRPFTKIEGKEFTKIELSTVREIEDIFIKDLNQAWESVFDIKGQTFRTEVNPQFVGICPPTDIVIATTFEVELENQSGVITLVVPYGTIEPIKEKLSNWFQISDADSSSAEKVKDVAQSNLLATKADLTVMLGQVEVPISTLRNLKVGDELVLSQNANDPIGGFIDGKKVLGLKYEISPNKSQTIKLTVMGGK